MVHTIVWICWYDRSHSYTIILHQTDIPYATNIPYNMTHCHEVGWIMKSDDCGVMVHTSRLVITYTQYACLYMHIAYICMCIHAYVCIYTYRYTYVYLDVQDSSSLIHNNTLSNEYTMHQNTLLWGRMNYENIYIYVCVYMHIYLCVYMHIYLCVYMHIYVCVYVHIYVCVYMQTYACVCMHIYACVYICMCIHALTCMCINAYISMCIHAYICMCIHAYICIYTYRYTYVYLDVQRRESREFRPREWVEWNSHMNTWLFSQDIGFFWENMCIYTHRYIFRQV